MIVRFEIAALSVFAAVAVGCSTDFAVPQEAQLGCKSAGDCPSGWTCNAKVGRCVKTESIDADAPALVGDVTVAPSMLKKGAKATLAFTVSEELSTPPVVTLSAGTERLLTTASSLQPPAYVFSYTAAGDEPQSVESPISIVLTDKSGNESGKLSGKSVKFDFIAPGVVDAVVAGSPVNKDGMATVTFTVNETPATAPVVKLATGEALTIAGEPKDNRYAFTYKPTTNEREDEAGVGVTVDLADSAGNVATGVDLGAIVFDFVAPALKGVPVVTPAVAKAGMTVTVAFEASEPLSTMPVVHAGGKALAGSEFPGNSYEFGYKVAEGEADGERAIEISLADRAGNALVGADGGSFVLDSTTPQLGTLVTSSRRYSARTGFNTVALAFDCSEDVEGGLVATVGEAFMTCGAWQAASPNYACAYPVTGQEAGGTTEVAVAAIDKAGNIGFKTTSVELDFTGPVLTLAVQPSGRPARLGELVTVSVAASEALDASGIVVDSQTLNLGAPAGSGSNYSWTYTVKATDSGSYNLSATATDAVGNPAAVAATGTLALDGVVPVIGSVAADKARYSRVSGFNTVKVTFDSSEDVGAGLSVKVGDVAMTCDVWSATAPSYTCTHAIAAGDSGGVKSVEVKATDAAGNSAYGSGSVEYDFAAPVITGTAANPSPAPLGGTVTYTVTTDEPISNGTPPTLAVTGAGGWSGASITGAIATWTHTVGDGAGENGLHDATVGNVCDAVGNCVASFNGAPVNIDNVPPSLVASPAAAITISTGYEKAKDGAAVTVVFTSSEALSAVPTVKLGTKPMSCAGTHPAYTCTRTVSSAGGEDPEGMAGVLVTLADTAQNQTTTNIGSVEIDFTPPDFAATSTSPNPAKNGVTVAYSVTANEPLSTKPADAPTMTAQLHGGTDTYAFVLHAGTTYVFEHASGGVTDGWYDTSVAMVDRAGNSATRSRQSEFEVNASVPVISNLQVTPARASAMAGHKTVTATFDCTEPVTVDAKVGAQATSPCTYTGSAPALHYTCAYTVQGNPTDVEGQNVVSVRAYDAYGNQDLNSGSAVLDFTAPALISTQAAPGRAKVGDVIYYDVTASEPLLGNPELHLAGPTPLAFTHVGGTTYKFQHLVHDDEDGDYTVTVDLTDDVGNSAPGLAGGPFSIDTDLPNATITAPAAGARYSKVPGHDQITVNINTENLDTPPASLEVYAGGGKSKMTCGTYQAAPPNYVCSYTLKTWDVEGPVNITVTARDAAGNTLFKGVGIEIDTTPPAVVGTPQVALLPDATNPLRTVTKVTDKTTVQVAFTLNELLSIDPAVATESPETLPFTLESGTGTTSFVVTHQLAGLAHAQGTYTIAADLTDKAGNFAHVTLGTFTVDTTAPTPITAVQNDKILYRRIPWGADATAGVKRFTVKTLDAQTGAVEPNANVIFWDAADTATAAEIGRTTADGNGYFAEKELNRADRAHVYLTQADQAGNVDSATATEIVNHEWTATMGYKVPGSGFDNPHLYLTTPIFPSVNISQTSFGSAEPLQSDMGRLAAVDAQAMALSAEQRWRELPVNTVKPAARKYHAMAYDAARGKAVMFGGDDDFSPMQDTWEWDGATGTWTDRTPSGSKPAPRTQHAMAYDAARGRVVMFGGGGGAYLQDTWEWDGAAGTWTNRTPAGAKPGARRGHTMVYDAGRGKVVLFGGYFWDGTDHYYQDTWEWDGATGTWTDRTPGGGKPSVRMNHSAAYDRARGKVVLFGGYYFDGASHYYQDTWEWDCAAGTWTERTPVTKPSGRYNTAMVYDASRGKALMTGGDGPFDPKTTWEWDGSAGTWTDRTPVTQPFPRGSHAMAFDAVRAKTVVFGGRTGGVMQDTWEWDGSSGTWVDRTPNGVKPGARHSHAMAYDASRGRAVVFGGQTLLTGYAQDTWEWDGASGTWLDRTPGGLKPVSRYRHALAYDPVRKKIVLFGGSDGVTRRQDTWEWDCASGTWTDRTPAGLKPTARENHAMTYDAVRGRVVMFGGNDGAQKADIWEWDGAGGSWSDRTPGGTKPAARDYHAIAFDSARGKVVLFGGADSVSALQDTWEWDGTAGTWTDRTPSGTKPAARVRHSMAYDSSRAKVVMFGGQIGSFVQDTWEWDGATATWADRTPPGDKPSGRNLHAMAYDSARKKLVLFGGFDGNSRQDTWEWEGGDAASPGQAFLAVFGAAGVTTSAAWRSLRTTWSVGGVGYPGGVTTNGTTLMAWDGWAWGALATNNSPPGSPSLVAWTTTDSSLISRLFFGDQKSLNFAVTPTAPNGTGTGEIAVDYAEVIVGYKLP